MWSCRISGIVQRESVKDGVLKCTYWNTMLHRKVYLGERGDCGAMNISRYEWVLTTTG